MMNPPVISNSGSLEDCHTNFFALTDLCGIRWRKFVFIDPSNEPLKDPILRSYARCLRENILCVWRRISTKKMDIFHNNMYDTRTQNTITFPPLSLKTSKELWIFWYGEEPDLNELLVPELMKPSIETAEGSYENGISYECRSLLFKALHNLIERCLLSRGVMRLGKWFVQPCTRQDCSIDNGYHHMSFSFGFFVHGESTVCTSIDIRNHPNVRRLTIEHVKEAAMNSDFNQHPVILAPFGLAGTLTGKYYKPTDPITKKTLKEWSVFYPLLRKTEYHYPPVVEVVAGGVKMCYPAKYVLVTDIDDEEFSFSSIPKMFAQDDMNEIENENKITSPVGIENIIGERVWQECVVSSQILASNEDDDIAGAESTAENETNFEHPTARAVCNCTIRKNPHKQSNCCFNHHHSNQLMADISSAITSMGSPSSPELSPYFPYSSSVSPPEYESQPMPIPSPNQLSSQYELQNFLNSSSDYDDSNSPFVLSADHQQNNTLTPNPSPDSIVESKVNAIEQMSVEANGKGIGKHVRDDDSKEKITEIKTEAGKNSIATSSDAKTTDSTSIASMEIHVKTENLSTEIEMDVDSNQLNEGGPFISNALENIFSESNLNESETKPSTDTSKQSKKVETDRKNEKNFNDNDSSDSDDDDDDSDDSDSYDSDDDDDDDDGSQNDGSADEQKKETRCKLSEEKVKKYTSGSGCEGENEGNAFKNKNQKNCGGENKDSADKISESDSSAKNPIDIGVENNGDANKKSNLENVSENISDKLEKIESLDIVDGNSAFGLLKGDIVNDGGNRTENLQTVSNILNTALNADNHSNISDSDAGDFPDDGHLEELSNDSIKSGIADFTSRLPDNILAEPEATKVLCITKDKSKAGNTKELPYTRNFLDNLNSTDSSDSNASDKGVKAKNISESIGASNLDSAITAQIHDHETHGKTSQNSTDSRMKNSRSNTPLIGTSSTNKNADDDTMHLELNTDNISDDEYDDIKPGNRRKSENREGIVAFINPAANSLNAIISADYSNMSDNNDTNSNDHNRESSENKRNESPANSGKAEGTEHLENDGRNANKDVSTSEHINANIPMGTEATLVSDTSADGNENDIKKKPNNSSPKNFQEKVDNSSTSECIQTDNLLKVDNSKNKGEGTISNEPPNIKSSLGSSEVSSNIENNSNINTKVDNVGEIKGLGEICNNIDEEVEFSINFLDELSLHDSNHCNILENIIGEATKSKDNSDSSQMLPISSNRIAGLDLDSESLSQIMDSIKTSPNLTEAESKRKRHSNSPLNGNNPNAQANSSDAVDETARFSENISAYISPVRDGGLKSVQTTDDTDGNGENSIQPVKVLGSLKNDGIAGAIANNITACDDRICENSQDNTQSRYIKTEKSADFLDEHTFLKLKSKDSDSAGNPLNTDEPTGSSKIIGNSDNITNIRESGKIKKISDNAKSSNVNNPNTSKTSIINSGRSTKSGKKSKNTKVDSKKSAKTSSKSDKNKATNLDKNNENATTSTKQTPSAKPTYEKSCNKRILKPTKRPHRTMSATPVAHPTYNYESIASLMKTPVLSVRNHDFLAESNESPQMLYDFSTWEAWMNHPVKRFKASEPTNTKKTIVKELQELYSKQNVRLADFKSNPPNSVDSKSISDGLQTSDDDGDHDYYNDSGSQNSSIHADNLSDYDLQSPDMLCSPTNFSDIYYESHRNTQLATDVIDIVDPDCSEISNEDSIQDWSYVFASPKASKFYVSSKYAPLSNISAPPQPYLAQNIVYKPSWESASNSPGKLNNKKNKNNNYVSGGKSGPSTSKTKSKNKHKNSSSAIKIDSNKSKVSPNSKTGDGDIATIKKEIEASDGKLELKKSPKGVNSNSSPNNKEENKNVNIVIKEEPQSDTEFRNDSESDSDSETDNKKSAKSKTEKSAKSKKVEKDQKKLSNSKKSNKITIKTENPKSNDNATDDTSSYDNNGNSDDNSNDSRQSLNAVGGKTYMQEINVSIKTENDDNSNANTTESESTSTTASSSSATMPTTSINTTLAGDSTAALKTSPTSALIKTESGDPTEAQTNAQRDETDNTGANNLDKSSSSMDEFDNEKPAKIVTVNINFQYENEDYNNEINVRKFHRYQRNIDEMNNVSTNVHISQFDTVADTFAFDTSAGDENEQQLLLQTNVSSSSDTDSDDSDVANELDDSDNSSCAECTAGACSPSILPPLPYRSTSSNPASSTSSYYNQNFSYLENIAQPVQRLPETNALILNLLLYDTSLNVFRDHNFDSCSLCVCHTASDGTFGNIRGSDSGKYLPLHGHSFSQAISEQSFKTNAMNQFESENDRNKRLKMATMMGYLDTDPIHCTCGYSAIANRRLSHKSGLFYDDENEITGIAEDPSEHKLREKQSVLLKDPNGATEEFTAGMDKICGAVPQVIMDYIQEQCTCVQNSTNSVQRSIRFANDSSYYNIEDSFMNVVEFCDAQDIIRVALNNSKLESQFKTRKNTTVAKSNAICTNVHKWPYIKASIPPNNKDVLKFMQMIMPILQGSFNKKYMTRMWEAPYAIQGPLTWRQFHRLASTHSGQCEPQPIPSIVVGHEKEWLSVSPFAIQYWDQLMLEPYSYTRDVAYIVVAPDDEYIVDEAKQFFKELCTMYEICKLGRHCPIKGCDGILRSGKNTNETLNDEFEELYALFEDNKTIEIIKSYVQTCQQHLVPYLTNISSDKSILDPEPEGFNIKDLCYKDKSMSSPMFQPDTPEFSYSSGSENKEQNSSFESECEANASYNNAQTPTPTPATSAANEPVTLSNPNEDEIPPCIIIYVLNPLSFGHESDDLQRLSCIALLRSYTKILNAVPESIRSHIKLQIISMESILEMGQNCDLLRASDQMRCLALSIFSQCRRNLTHDVTAKILTGFGTAANLQTIIKNKDCVNRAPYKLYAPPYILSGREETIESSEVFGASTVDTPSSVLYCNYCLSEDQKWLLAVATDERGELLETITINVEVANLEQSSSNRTDSIRRQSLQKLMDFIVGIISQTSQQWRIVIGRVGRIGHGELKAWSWLLCKSSLVKTSKQLKDVCDQCSMMYLHSCPSIVSACLLTLEPDTSFRILSDQFTPDERFSQIAMQSTLSTPSDLSCTHILVLPINASAQAVQSYPEHHITDFSEEELFVSLGNGGQGIGGINGLNGINNMNSMNGMNNMNNLNGMNSMNGMNVMNGINGLNNINGLNMNSGNGLNNLNGMNGLNAINSINDLGGVNNLNGLSDVNSINGLNSINGIDGMDGMDGIDPMEGMDPIDAIDAMEAMDGMDDVNMNGIEDFFSNDWENEIQLPTDNPQDDPTLDHKLDGDANPNDQDQQLLEPKTEHAQDSKQDHDQKPHSNMMLSVNMSGLGHQVKLESNAGNMQMQLHNTSDEFGQMMQQPLAIGFMVSTAPMGRMPPWFWANCPQLENVNPVFLKSSLHIHSPLIHQNSNEYINQRFSHAGIHPLDSPYTADTMRYILESYNFLSWLAIDPNTNDRISCLPSHIQVLIQLYNMVAAFT